MSDVISTRTVKFAEECPLAAVNLFAGRLKQSTKTVLQAVDPLVIDIFRRLRSAS